MRSQSIHYEGEFFYKKQFIVTMETENSTSDGVISSFNKHLGTKVCNDI